MAPKGPQNLPYAAPWIYYSITQGFSISSSEHCVQYTVKCNACRKRRLTPLLPPLGASCGNPPRCFRRSIMLRIIHFSTLLLFSNVGYLALPLLTCMRNSAIYSGSRHLTWARLHFSTSLCWQLEDRSVCVCVLKCPHVPLPSQCIC